jgi:hypothetical protein
MVYKTCSEHVDIVITLKTCTWELLGLNLSQGIGQPDAGFHGFCSWLRHCATSWKVAGSVPDEVIGFFT